MKLTTDIKNIEQRLLEQAAEIWNVDKEHLQDFDPLVQLLLGACASEFSRLYYQLENADTRVIDRLAQIILPETLVCPQPGHTIIYSKPSQSKIWLRRNYSKFILTDVQNNKSQEPKEFYFSPVKDTRLWNAEVSKIVIGDFEKAAAPSQLKIKNNQIPYGHVWVGIDWNDQLENESIIPFYFQTKENDNSFFRLLSMTKWSDEVGNNLNIIGGLLSDYNKKNVQEDFHELHQVDKDIKHFYSRHYVNLELDKSNSKISKKKFPDVFNQYFDQEQLNQFDQDLFWLKIEFPSIISNRILNEFEISLNIIPVVNRIKNTQKHNNLKKGINIFPLKSEEQFLTVESVNNDNGYEYDLIQSPTLQAQKRGSYALRQGGINKMDKRDAYQLLHYLQTQIRDERMAFKALDNIELSKGLRKIEDWLSLYLSTSGKPQEVPTYLILNTNEGDDRAYINYWSTQGIQVNAISIQSKLSLESSEDLCEDDLKILQRVSGGTDRPNEHQRLNIFKSAFLSRGRIVTKADIRALCFQELGTWLDDLNISISYEASENPKTGLIKVVLVEMILKEVIENNSSFDASFWKRKIETLLERRSTGYLPFKVIFKNQI